MYQLYFYSRYSLKNLPIYKLSSRNFETRSKIKLIIWDLDGVILDNELLHIKAEIETLRYYGIPLTHSIAMEYLGVKLDAYFKDIIRRYQKDIPVQEVINKHFRTLIHYYKEVFPSSPHIKEVLAELRSNYTMAIATNRERDLVKIAHNRFSLINYFKLIICGEDVKTGKPDPEIFIDVSTKLRINPHLAVVVEDSETGFKSAKKAGMCVIARKAKHNQNIDFSLADFIVDDLKEIPIILKRI